LDFTSFLALNCWRGLQTRYENVKTIITRVTTMDLRETQNSFKPRFQWQIVQKNRLNRQFLCFDIATNLSFTKKIPQLVGKRMDSLDNEHWHNIDLRENKSPLWATCQCPLCPISEKRCNGPKWFISLDINFSGNIKIRGKFKKNFLKFHLNPKFSVIFMMILMLSSCWTNRK
jgi:hypothetical protein